MYEVVTDSQLNKWIRGSFILPEDSMDSLDFKMRSTPDGLFSFADTTLGGNACINPLPQYTGFADINSHRYLDTESDRNGFLAATDNMGRTYEERHNNAQIKLHMRFGVPTYNSMTRFLGNFYNSDAGNLAIKGRTNGIAHTIGKIIGTVATFPIQSYILVAQFIRFMVDMPSTKYFYLKPTMHLYNNARSNMINAFSSNLGFVAGMSNTERPEGLDAAESPGDMSLYSKLLPDIYNSNGSIDIYKVTTRYQRRADYRLRRLNDILDTATNSDEAVALAAEAYLTEGYPGDNIIKGSTDIDSYVSSFFSLDGYSEKNEANTEDPDAESEFAKELQTNILTNPLDNSDDIYGPGALSGGFSDSLLAEQRDGGQFVTFRIDDPGQTTYSGQNNFRESGIAQTINSKSQDMFNLRFNLMDGKWLDGPIGSLIGMVTSSVGGLLGGALESVGMSGIAAVMGNALVDIPKHFESAITNLPRLTAKMECRAWSGDPLTRLQNIYIPVSSVLAGCMPRSTGYQSYTGPFICEYYCKGRGQSRLAVIDSWTMRVGTGNVGYTKDNVPLGIDIEFTLIDLSSIVHMNIMAGFNPVDLVLPGGISKYLFSDQNTFTDMTAVLTSLDLVDQIYTTRRLRKNFHKTTLDMQQWFSAGKWASIASNSGFLFGASPGRMLAAFANRTDR